MPKKSFFGCLAAMAAAFIVINTTGCQSTGDSSGAFASVTITNRTPDQIVAATTQVFEANGYQGSVDGKKLVFEKAASRGTSFAREGVVAGASGAQTINRVRVAIVTLSGGKYRIEATAYMVTGGSDQFFQDEVPVTHIRRGPYQSMLNAIHKQLN
jgi:hypothetical protein